MTEQITTVSIRPGIEILGLLRHMQYEPWFALAEFVDNSVQSFIDNSDALNQLEPGYRLRVEIEIDAQHQELVIRDNAAGIAYSQYSRAFRPAAVPADTSGLSEFGIGMKSAACWFAPKWQVLTSALGEAVERLVEFDIERICHDKIEELSVRNNNVIGAARHFTEITLQSGDRTPKKGKLAKVKEHLRSIYRVFLREGTLELIVGGERLSFNEPKILFAPYYKTMGEDNHFWKTELAFDFGPDYRAHGFAAIREKPDVSQAGFALLRRNRVIQGSGDQGYRPPLLFGNSTTNRSKRLFGEIHLEGFEVLATKDGFKWLDLEDLFLEVLKANLERELPLIRQAEEYRVQSEPEEILPPLQEASEATLESLQSGLSRAMETISLAVSEPFDEGRQQSADSEQLLQRTFSVEFHDCKWEVCLQFLREQEVTQWLQVIPEPVNTVATRHITIKVAMSHPFMERFGNRDSESMEVLIRMAVALAVAEVAAGDAGVSSASQVRKNLNYLLRTCFSQK